MPLVAAPASFVGDLPGSQGLPPIVQPLGHEVSPLATPGLVVATARPVEASPSGSLPAPVQRRASRASAEVPPAAGPTLDSAAEAAVAAGPTAVAAEAPAGPTATTSVAEVSVPATVRSLPTVSRLTIRMPDRPLTSAELAAAPRAVQRAAAAPGGDSSAAPTTPRPAGGMRRAPDGLARSKPVVSRASSASSAPSAAPVAARSAHASSPPAGTLPSSAPRRGIGAPLDARPSSARPVGEGLTVGSSNVSVSRSAIAELMPLAAASLGLPLAQRFGDGPAADALDGREGAGTAFPGGTGASAASTAVSLAKLPTLPVVSRATPASVQAPRPATAPAAVQGAATGPVLRPVAGRNPIRPSVALQRSEADGGPMPSEPELPSPWWAPDAGEGDAASRGARHGDGRSTAVQRSPVPDPPASWLSGAGDGGGRAGATATAPAPARPAVQRDASPHRPLPPVRGASGSSSPSPAAATAITTYSARPVEPVVQALAAGPSAATAARSSGTSTPPPAVQRAEDGSAAGAMPIEPPASVPAQRSETDLEELAQALFRRISGRLRRELLHDREAKGLTFDNL